VEGYARRNPAVFVGAAFALGFLAARFLKTSSPNQALMQQNGNNGINYGGNSIDSEKRENSSAPVNNTEKKNNSSITDDSKSLY